MTTMFRYTLPVQQTGWTVESSSETCFAWEYEDGRDKLLTLYDKGKKQQWDAAERIDWSVDLDPDNPMGLDDRTVQIHGSDIWDRLTEKEKGRVRHHLQAQSISQSRVQKAYADMGVLDLAEVDAEALLEKDNRVAEEFDAQRVVAARLGGRPG